jgi:geranylgeranyl diphosphate synthase type II
VTQPVEAALARYAAITRTAMAEHLETGRPGDYLHELVRDYPMRGGKAIRPALLMATCEAFGGSVRDGIGPAVALEMMHNAFLIHDDIQDGSRIRRGRPTLHTVHGVGLAINAGDALAALALQPLRDGPLVPQLLAEFSVMARQTTQGQALELGWRRDNVVDLKAADYLTLVGKKTCWYTTVAPLRMGALIATGGIAPLDALTRFGFYLGAAFQICDDLLSVESVDPRFGKERLDDIREGKRTLMLVHLLGAASDADRRWLIGRLATPEGERPAGFEERVLELMVRHGSIEFARDYAAGITAAAHEAFEIAFAAAPGSPHREFVRGLIPYMLARSR